MQSVDFTSTILVSSKETVSADERTMYGFRFWIKAERSISSVGDLLEIYLASEPESFCADSYQLLVDYQLTLLDANGRPCAGISVRFEPMEKGYSEREENERWTIRVGWEEAVNGNCLKTSPTDDLNPQSSLSVDTTQDSNDPRPRESYSCTVQCQLRIRDLLTAHRIDYSEEYPPRRDFALLLGRRKQFFVDLQYLADQGSEFFKDLLESKRKGVRRAVLMNVDAEDMDVFLDAICTHKKPVVTNRNFDTVLRLAQEFCVDKALRACESYLIETDAVHVIRKLEYAAEFGLGFLGETVIRRLTNSEPMAALNALHEYLHLNNESLDQMHPDVLRSLHVYDRYVVV